MPGQDGEIFLHHMKGQSSTARKILLPQGPFPRGMRPHCVVAKSAQLRFRLRRKLRPLPCATSPHCAGRGGGPVFVFDKKRMRRARWKRKNRFIALRHVRTSARRGSADRCKRRFGLAFGHAILFFEVGTAVPWRMVRRSTGCKNAFDQLLFPHVPLRYALLWRAWGHLYGDAKGHSSVRRGRCPHRPAVGAAITHRTAAVSGMHI